MSDEAFNGDVFDVDAWMTRIGYDGSREPTLPVLRAVIAAHTVTIPFENIDVLLGRPPKLDVRSLQRKMIAGGRGGYCFEPYASPHFPAGTATQQKNQIERRAF